MAKLTKKTREQIEQVNAACVKWMGYDKRSQLTARNMIDFATWLGDPMSYDAANETWTRLDIVDMEKPEIRRKIELINSSPHWRTLLKVMEIQREKSE